MYTSRLFPASPTEERASGAPVLGVSSASKLAVPVSGFARLSLLSFGGRIWPVKPVVRLAPRAIASSRLSRKNTPQGTLGGLANEDGDPVLSSLPRHTPDVVFDQRSRAADLPLFFQRLSRPFSLFLPFIHPSLLSARGRSGIRLFCPGCLLPLSDMFSSPPVLVQGGLDLSTHGGEPCDGRRRNGR